MDMFRSLRISMRIDIGISMRIGMGISISMDVGIGIDVVTILDLLAWIYWGIGLLWYTLIMAWNNFSCFLT